VYFHKVDCVFTGSSAVILQGTDGGLGLTKSQRITLGSSKLYTHNRVLSKL